MSGAKPGNGGAEMGLCRIPEGLDQVMPLECLLNDAALYALPAAMDQPNFTETGRMRGGNVLVDDRRNIAWCERVQVEAGFDRDAVRHRQVTPLRRWRSRRS